jgi:hypothetical protein
MGLIWIGEKFYKTTQEWMEEGRTMGVSRRIKGIPNGFKVGETWVAVAHIEGIPGGETWEGKKEKGKPAIFQVFKPSAIEYVVKGDETEEELTKLEGRGISLVKVVKIEERKPTGEEKLASEIGLTA